MLPQLSLTELIRNHYRKVFSFPSRESLLRLQANKPITIRLLKVFCENLAQRAKDWILELRKSLPLSFPIILVGNKSDLKQKVNFQSHESITSYHETSAKLNTGIRNVIHAYSHLSAGQTNWLFSPQTLLIGQCPTIWSKLAT